MTVFYKKLDLRDTCVAEGTSVEQSVEVDQLSITTAHALRAGLLPIQHRDPFDRMIMAQSELEQIPVITYDPAFKTGLIEVIR